MTEEEWLAGASPVAMLHRLYAEDFGYPRKPTRYAIAVCARQPELLTSVLRDWIELVELLLLGNMSETGVNSLSLDAELEANGLAEDGAPGTRAQYAAIADVVSCAWISAETEYDFVNPVPPEELEPVRRANANLVRDLFGNPFREVAFDAGCDNEDVLNHRRDPKQVHVRGCWVVDLVLGKE